MLYTIYESERCELYLTIPSEIALLTAERRIASVIASEVSELYVLNKSAFDEVVDEYPAMRKVFEEVVQKRLQNTANQEGKRAMMNANLDTSVSNASFLSNTPKVSQPLVIAEGAYVTEARDELDHDSEPYIVA